MIRNAKCQVHLQTRFKPLTVPVNKEPAIPENVKTPLQPSFDLNNIDLVPFKDDDDILIKYLDANPDMENQVATQDNTGNSVTPHIQELHLPTISTNNVQNIQNIGSTLPPIIPKMSFQTAM